MKLDTKFQEANLMFLGKSWR